MILRLKMFGFEIGNLSLEFPAGEPDELTVVDVGIKRMSRWWVSRMGR